MKNISLYVLLTALTVGYVTGQNNAEQWQPDTITIYNTNEDYVQRIIFEYDNKGNRKLYLRQNWNINQWENSLRIAYTYDNNGNTLTIFNQSWSGSQWGDTNKTIYTYNNQNKILTSLTQTNQLNKNFGIYQYDNRGNNVELLAQNWNNNQWENYSLKIYEYDSNDNQICSLTMFWQNNQWDSSSRILNTYNANNKITEYIYQPFSNNQWKNQYRDTYTYDTNGNELEDVRFNWKDTVWEENGRDIKTYDANNNLLTYAVMSLPPYQALSTKTTYIYDGNNNILSKLYEGLTSGGMWYPKTQNFYTYDERNNRLTDSALIIPSGIWYNDAVFRWEYDENSNSVLGFNQKWDYGLNDWKNDNSANLISAYYNNMQSSYNVGRIYKFSVSYKKTKIKTTQVTDSICQGNIYNFHGKILTQSDIYYDTLQAIHGCDSVIELNLSVISIDTTHISAEICQGESYDFFGNLLTTNGVRCHTLQSVNHCDSVIELRLTVTVGIVETQLIASLPRIYPNPTTGKLIIENGELKIESIEIYDIYGRKHISLFTFHNSPIEVDISHLATGMYFLNVGEKVYKVIKM